MSDKQGLYPKYHVTDRQNPDADCGRMFILRPDRDPHAATVAAQFPETMARFRRRYWVTKPIDDEGTVIPCVGAIALPVDDAHVRVVLSAYAAAVEGDNPVLAGELRAMVGSS